MDDHQDEGRGRSGTDQGGDDGQGQGCDAGGRLPDGQPEGEGHGQSCDERGQGRAQYPAPHDSGQNDEQARPRHRHPDGRAHAQGH